MVIRHLFKRTGWWMLIFTFILYKVSEAQRNANTNSPSTTTPQPSTTTATSHVATTISETATQAPTTVITNSPSITTSQPSTSAASESHVATITSGLTTTTQTTQTTGMITNSSTPILTTSETATQAPTTLITNSPSVTTSQPSTSAASESHVATITRGLTKTTQTTQTTGMTTTSSTPILATSGLTATTQTTQTTGMTTNSSTPILATSETTTQAPTTLITNSPSVTTSQPSTSAASESHVATITSAAVAATCVTLILCLCIAVYIYLKRRGSGGSDSSIPIYTISSVPVRVEEYEAYYKRQSDDSQIGFAEEFEDLKPVGTAQSTTTARALENKSKNRYADVLPYEPSRVKLSILSSQFDDYINANYIPGENSRKEFIACQGPLPNTISDFWRMIWEKNIRTIVMLTGCNEQGRVKCEQYWPPESECYNNIIVTTTSEIALNDWTLRDFNIKNVKTAETRSVCQFHCTAWQDHGVPQTTELLINFRHLVREHMDQYSLHSPTVVHCSAGVGRTGTFIAVDRIIFQIERENMVDVYGIVYNMRMHRPYMVQTEDQYVFLHQCALDIIRSRMSTNVDLIYQNVAAIKMNGDIGKQ